MRFVANGTRPINAERDCFLHNFIFSAFLPLYIFPRRKAPTLSGVRKGGFRSLGGDRSRNPRGLDMPEVYLIVDYESATCSTSTTCTHLRTGRALVSPLLCASFAGPDESLAVLNPGKEFPGPFPPSGRPQGNGGFIDANGTMTSW